MKALLKLTLFFCLSAHTSAQADVLFAPLWRRVQDDNNCVHRYNSFDDSSALRIRFKTDSAGYFYNSQRGWSPIPSCEGFLFRSLNKNLFFIEQTRVSEQRENGSWKERYSGERPQIISPRVGFDPENEVVLWLGDDGDTDSPTPTLSYNVLTTWDLRNGKVLAKRVPVGIGHNGMSDAIFLPKQKAIVIASMDEKTWYPRLAIYDYYGTKVKDLTGITQYIRQNTVGSGWEFKISLGQDTESGLLHLITGDQNFLVPLPRKNRLYIMDIQTDKVIKTQDGV